MITAIQVWGLGTHAGSLIFAGRTPEDLRRVDMRIQEFNFKHPLLSDSMFLLGWMIVLGILLALSL
jgi:hypothetical protein